MEVSERILLVPFLSGFGSLVVFRHPSLCFASFSVTQLVFLAIENDPEQAFSLACGSFFLGMLAGIALTTLLNIPVLSFYNPIEPNKNGFFAIPTLVGLYGLSFWGMDQAYSNGFRSGMVRTTSLVSLVEGCMYLYHKFFMEDRPGRQVLGELTLDQGYFIWILTTQLVCVITIIKNAIAGIVIGTGSMVVCCTLVWIYYKVSWKEE